MLNILAFVETATIVSAVKIALAALALICTGFIVFIVMKQSGNSDGMELDGSSKNSDESETFYGKNAGSRKEARLKLLTYIAAGLLAVCCIVMIVLQTFIK